MFSFILIMLMTLVIVWGLLKFMYPKPPDHYYPKAGDVLTARICDHCGHPLSEYRGVVEPKPQATQATVVSATGKKQSKAEELAAEAAAFRARAWFFCNYEHQAAFHETQTLERTDA